MSDFPVRLVLEEKEARNRIKYKVAWENSWVDEDKVKPSVDRLKNLKILGITNDSDEKKITQAKFVIENLGVKNKENQQETWTYQKLREKAPELLLDFYEQQLEK
ncbi:hypothetical protein PRIPAC_73660 [Pristionchus pacificus]|uniref:Uncharacterized protein n=1 Tax=Pristionchus pacificus TaxID=54126 RepID=A0A454XV11_PRIPA|nr:hypothetical protein PRIPAC_73660 [Pristionchus pacificus]|eukprot:PDM71578.1 hypothetical protein PRIPAC_37985 [Pristionchus pacificus]